MARSPRETTFEVASYAPAVCRRPGAADATAEESVARQYGERPQPGALGGTSDVFEPAWFTILPTAVSTGQGGMFGRDEPYGGAFGRDEVASGAMGQDEPYGGAFARDGG